MCLLDPVGKWLIWVCKEKSNQDTKLKHSTYMWMNWMPVWQNCYLWLCTQVNCQMIISFHSLSECNLFQNFYQQWIDYAPYLTIFLGQTKQLMNELAMIIPVLSNLAHNITPACSFDKLSCNYLACLTPCHKYLRPRPLAPALFSLPPATIIPTRCTCADMQSQHIHLF